MTNFNIKITIKDKQKKIRYWSQIDHEDFKNAKHIKIFLTEQQKKEFKIEEDFLELKYVATRKFISYGKLHSLYNLTIQELESLLKNKFKQVKFPIDFPEEDQALVVKKLNYSDYEIIPLDDKFYIKTSDSEFTICIHSFKLKAESI